MSQPNKNDGFLVPVSKTIGTVAIQELKAPAANRGRHNEIVLEEEDYLKNLEKVVNRSFFPLLHAADLNQNSEDLENSTNLSGVDPMRVQRDVDVLTVNEFMGRYNSEDNVSLEKLMDQDEEAWKKKFWWIQKQADDFKQKQLAIQAASDNKLNNMIEGNKQMALMSADYEEKNNFMFMPATKSREIKTYSDPESNEFKKIVYENTRFDASVLHQLNEQPLSRKSTSRSALPVDRLRTPNLLGYDEKKKSNADEAEKAQNVRGFNVLSMPSPSPNMATPQMTWGEVEGTPLILDRERKFKIQETSRRDNLGANLPLELARKKKLAQSQQKQKIKEMLTPLSSRKESDLRRGSSVLLDSKKIKRDGTGASGISRGAMAKPKIGGASTITIDKKDLIKSNKGLPGDLLHFK